MYQKLKINQNKMLYQDAVLTIYASPLPIPFSLAYHTWIEVKEDTRITRWEVWQKANLTLHAIGHVHKNLFQPQEGIRIFYIGSRKFKPKTVASFPMPKGITEKLENIIAEFPAPYTYRYLPGPNSNTFIAWIIHQLNLENKIKLPWRAVGKNYLKHIQL